MNTNTTPAAVGSSEELGHLFVGEAYHQWLTQPAADAMRCVDTRAAFEAGWRAAAAAERDRFAALVDPKPPLTPSDHEWLVLKMAASRIREA